jgi:hypothetical protein
VAYTEYGGRTPSDYAFLFDTMVVLCHKPKWLQGPILRNSISAKMFSEKNFLSQNNRGPETILCFIGTKKQSN